MKITEVLQDIDETTHSEFTTMSRNYKMEAAMPGNMQTSMQGNIIFDPSSQLPKEVMLETTLKAFGYNIDMWEVCKKEATFLVTCYNNQLLILSYPLFAITNCCIGS